MGHPFAHIELTSGNIGQAKKFYKDLFGWKLTDMKGMPYTMIDTGKAPGGGMQPQPMPHAPITWLPYVEVDDVNVMLAKAVRGGAHVVLDYMPIAGNGAIGIFEDPSGAMLGVWEAAKKKAAAKPAKKAASKKAAPKKSPAAPAKKAAKAPAKKAAKAPAKKKTSKKR